MNNIYDYIKSAEAAYLVPVNVTEGYEWSMRQHIVEGVLYPNGRLTSGKDDNKPVKNIMRPLLNVRYRAEGFDVKDIGIYVEDADAEHLSFLLKKAHDEWAREQGIDTFIDGIVKSSVDFGGTLVKNANADKPEVVPMQSIAFCDQTDLLGGPIGIKHQYDFATFMDMERFGWGNTSKGATATLQEVLILARDAKAGTSAIGTNATKTGDYVEVYEVHGMFPKSFIGGSEDEYSRQMHIVTFYTGEDNKKNGITLFASEQDDLAFKAYTTDPVYGRALGTGGVEELTEAQVWTNYGMIRMKQMLDGAASNLYDTDDPQQLSHQSIDNLENNTILPRTAGTAGLRKIDTYPTNIPLFNEAVAQWEMHAKTTAAAHDAIQGVNPTSGTPFALQQLVTAEAHSLHTYRMGITATFVEEIYREWIIPRLVKYIKSGKKFIADLSLDELNFVADRIANNRAEDEAKKLFLEGTFITQEKKDELVKFYRDEVTKRGNKQMIEIIGDEFDAKQIRIKITVAGKQKNLAQATDKLVNIFRQVMQAPQLLQDKGMAKLFNQIIEYSGLDPVDFSGLSKLSPAPQQADQLQLEQPVA